MAPSQTPEPKNKSGVVAAGPSGKGNTGLGTSKESPDVRVGVSWLSAAVRDPDVDREAVAAAARVLRPPGGQAFSGLSHL